MQYQNKWLCSYETLLFDTPDGDIDIGQYAPDGNGTGYYIRTKPKAEAQFEWVDLSFKTAGLKKVTIVQGYAYYDEFLTAVGATNLWTAGSIYAGKDPSQLPSGSVVRLQSNAKKYWDTAQIKDYPQPSRTEIVTVIPPPEPIPPKQESHSIALDAASNSGAIGAVKSYSWSHTCSGDNRLLVVGDSHERGTGDTTVTGITYNAVAMALIRSDTPGNSYHSRTTIYYLIAPATGGAKTIVVTFSGWSDRSVGGAISYTGAAQSGQPDAHNGANATSGTLASVDVTTIADNCWVFSTVIAGLSDANLICGNTQRWKVTLSGTVHGGGGSDTNGPKTPAGSQTMSWTLAVSNYWAISAVSFAPAPPPPAYYHGLKVEGVGELALCDVGSHPLRIRKGATTYGIELVETSDPNASAIRIKLASGVKAIRKYT